MVSIRIVIRTFQTVISFTSLEDKTILCECACVCVCSVFVCWCACVRSTTCDQIKSFHLNKLTDQLSEFINQSY